MQKILLLMTTHSDLRSEVQGWNCEDSSLYVKDKPIGMTPSPTSFFYKSVLEAMADGWRLMGPPVRSLINEVEVYDWWLEKI